MKLTKFEEEMYEELCERGKIQWNHTTAQETKALNRLVKKGYATFNGEQMYWEQSVIQ